MISTIETKSFILSFVTKTWKCPHKCQRSIPWTTICCRSQDISTPFAKWTVVPTPSDPWLMIMLICLWAIIAKLLRSHCIQQMVKMGTPQIFTKPSIHFINPKIVPYTTLHTTHSITLTWKSQKPYNFYTTNWHPSQILTFHVSPIGCLPSLKLPLKGNRILKINSPCRERVRASLTQHLIPFVG